MLFVAMSTFFLLVLGVNALAADLPALELESAGRFSFIRNRRSPQVQVLSQAPTYDFGLIPVPSTQPVRATPTKPSRPAPGVNPMIPQFMDAFANGLTKVSSALRGPRPSLSSIGAALRPG